ncbi:MAG: hypothetical protein JSS62_01495 [Verrucomicrobia bacterium]|nr:hypothetical protein [Verrucomicrobiota bacterium]MBS0645564.1 hypothetical protein [Verrucomicrobiota bacterium]
MSIRSLGSLGLHPAVNPQDLDGEGKVFSRQILQNIDAYLATISTVPIKLSRKACTVQFADNRSRSLIVLEDRVFALYRDHRARTKAGTKKGYVGCGHDGFIKLAQHLKTGQWVAVRIIRKDCGDSDGCRAQISSLILGRALRKNLSCFV